MNKSELTACISAQSGETKDVVNNVLGTFFDVVKLRVSQGHLVSLRGFCTFLPKKKPEKKARHIKENRIMIIPARTVPTFKPSKEFLQMFQN